MAGIGLCSACAMGDHAHHQRLFTDMSNVPVSIRAKRKVKKAFTNNRICDCAECRQKT